MWSGVFVSDAVLLAALTTLAMLSGDVTLLGSLGT